MRKIGATPVPLGRTPNARPLLYVEDNDENWHVAELRLASRFELVRAKNDMQACAHLRSRGSDFVAVLMDIELQGSQLNGIDLTRLLRGRPIECALPAFASDCPTLNVPIIFMTAYGDVYSEAALRTAGGDLVLTKPIDFKQLNMALMNLYVNRSGHKT